jgi:exo-beta-1,3-glucanase (GH17 family)
MKNSVVMLLVMIAISAFVSKIYADDAMIYNEELFNPFLQNRIVPNDGTNSISPERINVGIKSSKNKFPTKDEMLAKIYLIDNYISYPTKNDTIKMKFYYDGVNNTIKYICSLYKNKIWNNYYQVTMNYDDRGNMVSGIMEMWSSNKWNNNSRTSSTFTNDNYFIRGITEIWNNNEWQNYMMTTYEYDDNMNIVFDTDYKWLNSDWVNDNRMVYEYNTHNKITIIRREQWYNNKWTTTTQNEYSYDKNNFVDTVLTSNNYSTTLTFNNRYIYENDKNGNILVETYQKWNNQDKWVNQTRDEYSYTNENKKSSEINQEWSYEDKIWEKTTRKFYYYNTKGLDEETTIQQWYIDKWNNLSHYSFTYNVNWKLISKVYETYMFNKYVNENKLENKYDNFNNLTESTFQIWKDKKWNPADTIMILIDSRGTKFSFENAKLEVTYIESSPFTMKDKYSGVCYGPYRDNENPNAFIYPTVNEIKDDINCLSKLTKAIRTYSVADNLKEIPKICNDAGIDCYPGASLTKYDFQNDKEIQNLIDISKQNLSNVKGLIVGNENLLESSSNKIPLNKLIEYINKVKAETTLPVGYSDTYNTLGGTSLKSLIDVVDFLFINIHPYWEGKDITGAAAYVFDKWTEIKNLYPGKQVYLGETGWPSAGSTVGLAVPGINNENIFIGEFLQLAKKYDGEYFLFEIYDEKWKSSAQNSAEANWGLLTSNGAVKIDTNYIAPEARKGCQRDPAQKVLYFPANLPLYIYNDYGSELNSFYPTGWMGAMSNLEMDENITTNPQSGISCIRINYNNNDKTWAGIYWQFPLNNWGDYAGYKIENAKQDISIIFWAKGEKGGESIEFKTGGIDSGKEFKDSYGPISSDVITLTNQWKQYSINTSRKNIDMLLGGFCFTASNAGNPEGCVFYLDSIVITDDYKIISVPENQLSELNSVIVYPNPVTSKAIIKYNLKEPSNIKISLLNSLGEELNIITNEFQLSGEQTAIINSNNLSSGVYYLKIQSGKNVKFGRVIVVR